ncbi:MAG TPA: pyrroloquinoline quinone biosynthesis protein PqqE [Chthoniobacteraceae bacterium]|nr:pyrroloquinoline quinone biosynthesis protein PqqE [Chthoniobacteraceae bacterium]
MNPHGQYRPYALLAELTYRCPLHCPYCSNPVTYPAGGDLDTQEWARVFREAEALGVLHAGLSGGEPLLRRDLPEIIAAARAAGLYTNLITSGVGLDERRARELRAAGLDSAQISFQADTAPLGDAIAGTQAHARKLDAVRAVKESGIALSLNVVLHRETIDRLPEIADFAASLGAERLELANTQYYGWGFLNRDRLMPTRAQVEAASRAAAAAKTRHAGRMEIFYVLPDYYETRPKPCMNGWGRRYITVNPAGEALPCPTASSIPGLQFDNVRKKSLAWIWNESESFTRFRGMEWMPEPCKSCPQNEVDFGGCRCQAALLTGDAAKTDPVCTLSPGRGIVDEFLSRLPAEIGASEWKPRVNPVV